MSRPRLSSTELLAIGPSWVAIHRRVLQPTACAHRIGLSLSKDSRRPYA